MFSFFSKVASQARIAKAKFRPIHLSYGLIFLPLLCYPQVAEAEAKDVKGIKDIVTRIRGYTTRPSMPHPPPINVPRQEEHFDPFDSKMEQYYGMDQIELKNLVQFTIDGLWRAKCYVQDKQRTANPRILELISIHAGNRGCGIARWDESKVEVETVGNFKLPIIVNTLKKLMSVENNKCYGLVIGYPLTEEGILIEKFSQSRVKALIALLDSDPFFKGVPFCFINEHGCSIEARIICSELAAAGEAVRANGQSTGSPARGKHKIADDNKKSQAAKVILETFIWKVKKEELLSPEAISKRENRIREKLKQKLVAEADPALAKEEEAAQKLAAEATAALAKKEEEEAQKLVAEATAALAKKEEEEEAAAAAAGPIGGKDISTKCGD